MNVAALSFRDLEYVVAVADHRHFGKAALACSVSQPTLSAQLRKFEDYIGFEIFERASRSVLVTERGGEVVSQARVILNEGRRLYDIVGSGAAVLTGTFRLGLIATLGPYVTPLMFKPLRERYPSLNMVFTEGLAQHLLQAVEHGEIDAILATAPLRGPEMMELPVFNEELVLAVPRSHSLATVKTVKLADIDPSELILLNEGHCLRDQTLALFPERPKGNIQAAGVESLRQMVGAGMGIALLPQLAVQVGALLDDMVAYRMIRPESPQRGVSMFYRPSFSRIRDVRALRDLLRETLQENGTIPAPGKAPVKAPIESAPKSEAKRPAKAKFAAKSAP
ncbi:MAG: LysR substrate-binding domain-containing protein [Pseudolabrys sp.]|nr:LysR substrate-binding domain-containing protein [Pseudolabrys sp.]